MSGLQGVQRAKVTHTDMNNRADLKSKTTKIKIQRSNDGISPLAGVHTPSFWRTRRRDTPLEAFIEAGWPLFHAGGQPTFALVVGSPSERTNHLGVWDGSLKLENRRVSDILVQEIVEHQAHMCGWVG